jgi:hypothetical protein
MPPTRTKISLKKAGRVVSGMIVLRIIKVISNLARIPTLSAKLIPRSPRVRSAKIDDNWIGRPRLPFQLELAPVVTQLAISQSKIDQRFPK